MSALILGCADPATRARRDLGGAGSPDASLAPDALSYETMRSPRTFFVLTSLSILLAGCSSSEPSGEKAATAEPAISQQAKPLKVALLTPGPVSDAGWSALAYEGLQQVKKELGAEVNNQEATGPEKIKDGMRSYAQQGYDLVIGHGYEYNEPATSVAKDFPKTIFISSSGGKTAENVGAFRFYLEQGFYIAGSMAATMSKTGKLAMIGGPDVPSIRSTFKAFRAGAVAVNPKVDVKEIFTGKDSDAAAAKQATLAAIGQGADMVIHQANAGASGVFEACKEKGVFAFGANLNQNDDGSGSVLASAVIVSGPAFVELAKQVQKGAYKGSIVLMGMEQGAIDFAIDPKKSVKVPSATTALVDRLKSDIRAGKLVVPKDEF